MGILSKKIRANIYYHLLSLILSTFFLFVSVSSEIQTLNLESITWLYQEGYHISGFSEEIISHVDNEECYSTDELLRFNLSESDYSYLHPSYTISLKKYKNTISSIHVLQSEFGNKFYFLPDQLLVTLDKNMYPTPQHFLKICKCQYIHISEHQTMIRIWADDLFKTASKFKRLIGVEVNLISMWFDIFT